MFLIAVTGLAQSGKDTAARYILEKYRFEWFDFSRDVLADELKARNLPQTKGNMSSLGDELRKTYGADILAQKLVEKINAGSAKNVVVSGVRSPEEYQYLKAAADKFFMIRLTTDPKTRIGRSGNQGIMARDEQDIKNKGLSRVLELADTTIENDGTLSDLYKKIDEVMRII